MNQITIAGNLGTDPEVRFTSSEAKVTTLRVASRSRRSGKEETIWWRVTIWGEQFDKMISFLREEGKLCHRRRRHDKPEFLLIETASHKFR